GYLLLDPAQALLVRREPRLVVGHVPLAAPHRLLGGDDPGAALLELRNGRGDLGAACRRSLLAAPDRGEPLLRPPDAALRMRDAPFRVRDLRGPLAERVCEAAEVLLGPGRLRGAQLQLRLLPLELLVARRHRRRPDGELRVAAPCRLLAVGELGRALVEPPC